MRKITVLMGGPGNEFDVSIDSGNAIVAAIKELNDYSVTPIIVKDKLNISLLDKDSLIFNIIHGTYGEDGTLQKLLEGNDFKYIGCDSICSALCMNKNQTKKVCEQAGLNVPWGIDLSATAIVDKKAPFILKPRDEGSSVGLRKITDDNELEKTILEVKEKVGFDTPLILEEFLSGYEYTVSVVKSKNGFLSLPPLKITPSNALYDYEAKYISNETKYDIVNEEPLAEELQKIAKQAFDACKCKDLARVDIIANSEGKLHVIEINTLPGFTSHSLLPKSAAAINIDFKYLIKHLIELY